MMSLAHIRKVCLSSFLFPRHMAPELVRPVGAKEHEVYHEMCGFLRTSGRDWNYARFLKVYPEGADRGLLATYKGHPDLLDVLHAPR